MTDMCYWNTWLEDIETLVDNCGILQKKPPASNRLLLHAQPSNAADDIYGCYGLKTRMMYDCRLV